MSNPKSTASIAGHPIHPMLIPFPIAFFVATFVCDLAYWQTANTAWATAATWLLGAGLVMAALAAVAGLTDFLGDELIDRCIHLNIRARCLLRLCRTQVRRSNEMIRTRHAHRRLC